jgi:hypothetical protein
VLTPRSRRLILAALALTGALGTVLFRRQNGDGGMGGAISIPKLAWLSYTTFVWFLLCPILAFDPAVARSHRVVIGLFAAFMWARGALEIPMLFVWKNWRPPIGMAHDLAAAALLGWGLVVARPAPAETRPLDRWMIAFIAVQIASVLVECLYAGLFERAVRGATTGPGGVWFAADGDPRFVAINRLTALLDVPLILFLVAFLVVCLRGPGPRAGAAR